MHGTDAYYYWAKNLMAYLSVCFSLYVKKLSITEKEEPTE